MRIQTPYRLSRFVYFSLDTRARVRDEFLAAGIGRAYVGIYPTHAGFEISCGILDQNDSLPV